MGSAETNKPLSMNLIGRAHRQEFGRRLLRAMTDKGMSQSDLARACWGDVTNSQGTYPRGRDRISKYVRGEQMPDSDGIAILCKVLGKTVEDLAPGVYADRSETPWDVSFVVVPGQADMVALRVNVVVRLKDAAEAVMMLNRARERDAEAIRRGLPLPGPTVAMRERNIDSPPHSLARAREKERQTESMKV
jgi:transcriptional regulator with XRE-family HTH domain